MDSLVDDNFSEIRKTFTDPLYNAMGLHVDMGASFHDCGTRDDYGIGCCATLDGVTHYAKAWPIEDHDSRWGACMGSFTFDESLAGNGVDYVSPDSLAKIMGDYGYHDSRSFLKTLNTSEIIDTLRRFESPSYIVRGPIEDIESLPVGYYWCPDALDPDPSYNGYLLNVFAAFGGDGLPGKFFELFGGVTLNDVPSFGFDDGWDGSCLNRLDWFEDAAGMDADGLSAGLVANDAESIKALIGNCPAWIECFPSYSEKAAKGVDDAVQAVKAYRLEGKRVHREVIPGYLYETAKAAAAKTAGGADGGTGPHI